MLEFLKKMTEWILQKEEDAAKNCKIPIEEIDRQIQVVQEKKQKLEEECKKNIEELNRLIGRLESIKNIEIVKCAQKEQK